MKFDRPTKDLSRNDIESLLGEPEREDLEFKSELDRARNGDRDPWYVDQREVSDRSKHDLAREIVAFANRSGGMLVLGMSESETKPSVATGINPLPKPGELSERLLRSLHANIEPPLPHLNVIGIPTEADGSGVVLIEVGSSRSAPHRVRFKDFPKECYIRRNDECMPMDMRSIHDLVIERMRFATGLNELFTERSVEFRRFAHEVDRRVSVVTNDSTGEKCGGFRISSAALESIMIADITSKTGFRIEHVDVPYVSSMKPATTLKVREYEFRPVLRGWLGTNNDTSFTERLISGLGLLEDRTLVSSERHPWPKPSRRLYAGWLLSKIANHLHLIERLRSLTGQNAIEFGMEFEIRLPSGWSFFQGESDYGEHPFYLTTESEFYLAHRVSVGSATEFPALVAQLQTDLWNMFGVPPPELVTIE